MKTLLFLFCLVTYCAAAQNTLYVGSGEDNGTTDFADFAVAIAVAQAGDKIYVYPGNYSGPEVVIDKSLTIVGPGYFLHQNYAAFVRK